jgi:hypothetical protein
MALKDISTQELEKELKKRTDKKTEYCPTCRGKWPIYMGCSRSWREEQHCFGCRQPVAFCRC